jgi:hypothetical protein
MAFCLQVGFRRIRSCVVAATLILVPAAAQAVTVPFTESFEGGASGWVIGLVPSGTGSPAWSSTGGVADSGFISMSRTMSASQFNGSGFGFIAFRGNAANDASGDAFVGDWLAAGVSSFSAFVRHDAPSPLNFYVRIDAGGGAAGSSVVFSVPSNTWESISVPIVESPSSFQSYGNGTFSSVFSNVQNVQIALAATQPAEVLDGTTTYTFGLDSVAVVPEPSAVMLVLSGLGCGVIGYVRRRQTRMGVSRQCLWQQGPVQQRSRLA